MRDPTVLPVVTRPSPSGRARRALATLVILGLLSACTGNDDEPAAPPSDDAVLTDPGGPEAPPAPVDQPVDGGSLVLGLDETTAGAWSPIKASCHRSCHMVLHAVFDTLTVLGPDGTALPNLLEEMVPNVNGTEWRLRPRPGISFHDGTPFDAAAIMANLGAQRDGATNGHLLRDVVSISLSDDRTEVVVAMSRPWSHFPAVLAGQVGYMASPAWLEATVANPELEFEPVGTGPFIAVDQDGGRGLSAIRNPNYWRSGDGLPHLDEIHFVTVADDAARSAQLLDGDLDVAVMDAPDLGFLDQQAAVELFVDPHSPTDQLLFRVDESASPVSDVRVRKALGSAVDRAALVDTVYGGGARVATGPLSPGRSLDGDGDGQVMDLEAASAQLAAYAAETGGSPPSVVLTIANTPTANAVAEVLRASWSAVGVESRTVRVDPSAIDRVALEGSFQVLLTRRSTTSPDGLRSWWHSEFAAASPALATNHGRVRDADIDESLDGIRSGDDGARLAAASRLADRLSGRAYVAWLAWPDVGLAARRTVRGIHDLTAPDGQPAASGAEAAGVDSVVTWWFEDGGAQAETSTTSLP